MSKIISATTNLLHATGKVLKKHGPYFPLHLLVLAGCGGAVAYGVRLALHNPDVQWNRRKGMISNEEFRDKQYNLYSPNVDYSKVKSSAPIY